MRVITAVVGDVTNNNAYYNDNACTKISVGRSFLIRATRREQRFRGGPRPIYYYSRRVHVCPRVFYFKIIIDAVIQYYNKNTPEDRRNNGKQSHCCCC